MVFLTENWFWRGTQSAIFYYAACTPWVEYKHKRKRRREAAESHRYRKETIAQQPGAIAQPAPFETNESWAEEILRGPHPPKGWKKDPIYYKYMKKMKRTPNLINQPRVDTTNSSSTPVKTDPTALPSAPVTPVTPTIPQGPLIVVRDGLTVEVPSITEDVKALHQPSQGPARARSFSDVTLSVRHYSPELSATAVDSQPSTSHGASKITHSATSHDSDSTKSKRASFESASRSEARSQTSRPSLDRRFSTAMDTFKDAVRTTLHPDKWNWIRYERDDEILSNLNDKVRSMWGSVLGQTNPTGEERDVKLKRVESENQVKKWQRGTHPAINDLHPPVVSQLPYTPEEAKWMLLPPPSADVMMGRSRPDPFDDFNRKPLSVIGRPPPDRVSNASDHLQMVSSEEDDSEVTDAEDSSDEDWFTGRSHVQKPQRAYLRKHRTGSGP